MKTQNTLLALAILITSLSFGQTNTFPPAGYVGIGTIIPQANADITTAGAMSFPNTSGSTNTAILRVGYYDHSWAGGQLDMGIYNGDNYPAWIQVRNLANYSVNRNLLLNPNGGNVGIGTTSPSAKLDVNGVIQAFNKDNNSATWDNVRIWAEGESCFIESNGDENGLTIRSNTGNKILLMNNVGIGTTAPDEKLTVKGKIHAQEVRVDLQGVCAPDYVFQKYYTGKSELKSDYVMPTLAEIESFTKKNHHLPNVPSAQEVEQNGVSLGTMSNVLLQKVEELTLYAIEQNKVIEELKNQVTALMAKKQ